MRSIPLSRQENGWLRMVNGLKYPCAPLCQRGEVASLSEREVGRDFLNHVRATNLRYGAVIHLVLFAVAVFVFMPFAAVARVIDQMNETFEFIFSPVPLHNYYLLTDSGAETAALKLVLIFILTAVPSYVGGYFYFRYSGKRMIELS